MKLGVKLMLINLASFNVRITIIIRLLKLHIDNIDLKNKCEMVLTQARLESYGDDYRIIRTLIIE